MKKRFELVIEKELMDAIEQKLKELDEKANIKMSKAEYFRQLARENLGFEEKVTEPVLIDVIVSMEPKKKFRAKMRVKSIKKGELDSSELEVFVDSED